LGHHHPEELLHLIALLEKELGRKAQKVLLPMQSGDVVATYADIEESKTQLGFAPRVPLEEGISHFIKWYKDYFLATLG
jgi:UDP-glucuronate 4-epimerase